ncbi:hypothetical protein SLEP1_g7230 [Rubroshorea leprosula]|uniref:Reverse transcriptase Ty1/copia-type domain-containing protein n=1 Tax=Rubroshorea leprosula TaxID=152421 RepID=A0AAV5I8K4_9ROSI|nr:hypothetical protein SLEP1_g7230 [Rubroshorea leprosula]
MFSSLSNFQVSSFDQPPLFTNPSIELFPSDSNANTFDELHDAFQHSPSNSIEDVLPAGNVLDNAESSSLTSSISPIGSNPVDLKPENEILNPPSSHPTQQAMQDELQALDKTYTWDLVDLHVGKPLVGCKWVYKIKTQSNGSVKRYKARLVAKGFTQEYGIDYDKTFAPVARPTSIHSLIAIATTKRWKLFQMDVKNAFLNGDLAEEVYMKPPPRLEHPPNKVCRLKRALYGLKQAPRVWFAKFSTTISEFGIVSSPYDTALFLCKTDHGMVLLLLYVDDISGIHDFKQFLSHKFEMKDLSVLSYFLGLKVTSSDDGYLLSQTKYASDLISKAGVTNSKTASTPFEPNVQLTSMDGSPLIDPTRNRRLVRSLIYLTTTRPDIAYAVHVVSQFMVTPCSTHYATVFHIIRYIKGTMFNGLHFSAHSSLKLRVYSDADWAGDSNDRKSITRYCFFLGDSLISWRSKKQTVPSCSSIEVEYRALGDTTSELLNLRWLLEDMVVS